MTRALSSLVVPQKPSPPKSSLFLARVLSTVISAADHFGCLRSPLTPPLSTMALSIRSRRTRRNAPSAPGVDGDAPQFESFPDPARLVSVFCMMVLLQPPPASRLVFAGLSVRNVRRRRNAAPSRSLLPYLTTLWLVEESIFQMLLHPPLTRMVPPRSMSP